MYSHALSTRCVKKSWLLSKLKCLCVGFIAEHKYQVNLSIYVTIQKWLGSKGLSLTLFASLAMVAEAFSMRLQSSASADGGPKAGEVVDHLEDIVLFLMQGTLLASWPILFVFFRLTVSPMSVHAEAKRSMRLRRASFRPTDQALYFCDIVNSIQYGERLQCIVFYVFLYLFSKFDYLKFLCHIILRCFIM